MARLCECGCGLQVKNRFAPGHKYRRRSFEERVAVWKANELERRAKSLSKEEVKRWAAELRDEDGQRLRITDKQQLKWEAILHSLDLSLGRGRKHMNYGFTDFDTLNTPQYRRNQREYQMLKKQIK